MYCKRLQNEYKPEIYWSYILKCWRGTYTFNGSRLTETISENSGRSMEWLENCFNWFLVEKWKRNIK